MTEETKFKFMNPLASLPPNERIIVVAAIAVSLLAMAAGLFLNKESAFVLLNKIGEALLLLTRS